MAVCVRSSSGSGRAKRVTDPLDDRVKACICGKDHRTVSSAGYYSSSGSEHSGGAGSGVVVVVDDDHDSSCLSDLIHGFLEDGDDHHHHQDRVRNAYNNLSDDDDDDRSFSSSDFRNSLQIESSTEHLLVDLLNPIDSDTFRLVLYNRVSAAVEAFAGLRRDSNNNNNKAMFRRKVMLSLREAGYNAGICKSRWESCGGLTAGNYEFIDVIRSSSSSSSESSSSVVHHHHHQKQQQSTSVRYFIDVDFAGEFEIARATVQYERLLKVLPRVYVGRSEELKQIVKVMSEAAKRSLRSRDLLLSPWRKNRFMQMKWFGAYKRTVNQIPSMSTLPLFPQISGGGSGSGGGLVQNQNQNNKFAVKCQAIGFNVVSNGNGNGTNGRFVIPAATRTR